MPPGALAGLCPACLLTRCGSRCLVCCLRCRELLRDEIAQTLDDASQVEQELRSLLQALAC